MTTVRALGVVEHRSVGEFPVEEGEVGKEQIFGVVHEGLLGSPVEVLDVGAHCLHAELLSSLA